MLKGLKTFGIVFGGFVAVLLIAALGFVLFFPKTQAIAEVQRRRSEERRVGKECRL